MKSMSRHHVVVLAALCGCSFEPGSDLPGDQPGDVGTDASVRPSFHAPADPTWMVIETMTIDTANAARTPSKTILAAGEMYKLRASGTASVIDGVIGDSEYYDFASPKDNACCEDVGIGIDDPAVDLDTKPDWGPYNTDHIYEILWMGTGAAIGAAYQDTVYSNNSGNLTLEILAFR
jgi:hypothetical protein